MAAKQTEERPVVEETAPESEGNVHSLPEPKPELIGEEPAEGPKKPDSFEERMLKIMRLQQNLDDVLSKLKLISVTAYELHKELEKLKGA